MLHQRLGCWVFETNENNKFGISFFAREAADLMKQQLKKAKERLWGPKEDSSRNNNRQPRRKTYSDFLNSFSGDHIPNTCSDAMM